MTWCRNQSDVGRCSKEIFLLRNVHPPLGARTEVYNPVEVVVTGKHRNRAAPSGWMVRLVCLIFLAANIANLSAHARNQFFQP